MKWTWQGYIKGEVKQKQPPVTRKRRKKQLNLIKGSGGQNCVK